MKFDLEGKGLETLLRPYKVEVMRYLWRVRRAGSGKVWSHLQKHPDVNIRKSRASVIFFLNDMVDEDLVLFDDATGKGGHHRIYCPHPDADTEEKFKRTMAIRVQMALKRELLS